MNRRMWIRTGALCIVLCLALAIVCGVADAAAKSTSSADKGLAAKKGVSQSLGSKEIEQDKLPGKLEVGLGIGSVIAMIAVVKWL